MKYRKNELSEERYLKLEAIDFEWSKARIIGLKSKKAVAKQDWNELFEQLERYKEAYGDCLVPQKWRENKELADWVSWQRVAKKKGLLAEDHIEKLNTLSFDWDPLHTRWEHMFRELLKYKEEYGHTNVPQRCED